MIGVKALNFEGKIAGERREWSKILKRIELG
jgi:hypothetical protein